MSNSVELFNVIHTFAARRPILLQECILPFLCDIGKVKSEQSVGVFCLFRRLEFATASYGFVAFKIKPLSIRKLCSFGVTWRPSFRPFCSPTVRGAASHRPWAAQGPWRGQEPNEAQSMVFSGGMWGFFFVNAKLRIMKGSIYILIFFVHFYTWMLNISFSPIPFLSFSWIRTEAWS